MHPLHVIKPNNVIRMLMSAYCAKNLKINPKDWHTVTNSFYCPFKVFRCFQRTVFHTYCTVCLNLLEFFYLSLVGTACMQTAQDVCQNVLWKFQKALGGWQDKHFCTFCFLLLMECLTRCLFFTQTCNLDWLSTVVDFLNFNFPLQDQSTL
jgi:hypothetical protein